MASMSNPFLQQGFVIKKYRDMMHEKVFTIDDLIPMHFQAFCPACDLRLETLCALVGQQGRQKIRIGFCNTCGYIGYMDRPDKKWTADWYSSQWDDANLKDAAREEVASYLVLKEGRQIIIDLIENLHLDKHGVICEMGVGYGGVVRNLELKGFTKIIGVENSAHRARIVNNTYGYPVAQGSFEGPEVQHQLKQYSPIQLILSNHVLEHVYDPSEVIASVAAMQGIGDRLVLSLPNVIGEHSGMVTFFFSHLHSFTKESIERLLNKHGYQLTHDSSPDDSNIIIAAQKVEKPVATLALKSDYKAIAVNKLYKGLALSQFSEPGRYQVYWESLRSGFDMSRITTSSRLATIKWQIKNLLKRSKKRLIAIFPAIKYIKRSARNSSIGKSLATATALPRGYTMDVATLKYRYTDPKEIPFEIQFSGPIKVLIK